MLPLLEAQHAFKHLMIHGILQFALLIALRCVLHRCRSQDIHRWQFLLCYINGFGIMNNLRFKCYEVLYRVLDVQLLMSFHSPSLLHIFKLSFPFTIK